MSERRDRGQRRIFRRENSRYLWCQYYDARGQQMFNIARKDGRLRDMPYFPTVKEAAARNGFIEKPQYDALSLALPVYVRLPLALGYFTAMRKGEILKLRWNHVDFLVNVIRLRAGETKDDQGREVPIVPQLLLAPRAAC
jgi:integrase